MEINDAGLPRASLEKAKDVPRSGRLLRICNFIEKRKGWV